jgi:hypothetical protein
MKNLFSCFILGSLVFSVASCSVNNPVSNLRHEDNGFSAKMLSPSYLERKMNTFVFTNPDGKMVVKEISYGISKYRTLLKSVLNGIPGMKAALLGFNEVQDQMIVPSFAAFINELDDPPLVNKIAFVSNRTGKYEIYSVDDKDSNGDGEGDNTLQLTDHLSNYTDQLPGFSNTKVAFPVWMTNNYLDTEIYVKGMDGNNLVRLTTNEARDLGPKISSDGNKIAFVSNMNGDYDIYAMDSLDSDNDGNGDNLVQLTNKPGFEGDFAISNNGKLAYAIYGDGLFIVDINTLEETRLTTLSPPAYESSISISDDGSKIAYLKSTSPLASVPVDVKVFDVNNMTETTMASYTGGVVEIPIFSKDGTKVVIRRNAIMHVIDVNNPGVEKNLNIFANYPIFLSDGRIAYNCYNSSADICVVDADDADNDGTADNNIQLTNYAGPDLMSYIDY